MRRSHRSGRAGMALLGLVFSWGAVSAHAQGAPESTKGQPELISPPSPEPPAESLQQDSPVGPGDLLDIAVFGAPEMNCTVRVSSNGEISLQLLGAVRAAGLSPRQLESALEALLRRSYMQDPHVAVFIRELQSHAVSVVGAVKKPGVFQIQGTKSVLELLSMAEGLADDAGDTLMIMRGARSAEHGGVATENANRVEEVHLKRLLESSDPALNVPVHPGDIVKVARAGIVYVVGEVHKPGGFVLQNNENISVLQALALAEGLTHTSAKSQARIIRTESATGQRMEIPLNLGRVLAGKVPDPILQPKDIVFVPNSLAKGALLRGSEAALVTATGVAIYRW
jgi:polysaccharide export outer membrane protein